MLICSGSISIDIEGGGVEGGRASDMHWPSAIVLEDMVVRVGGIESFLHVLDVVMVGKFRRGLFAVVADHIVNLLSLRAIYNR